MGLDFKATILPKAINLSVWRGSAFQSAISRSFGEFPVKLTADSIPVLRAMYDASGEEGYKQLIDILESDMDLENEVLVECA